MDKGDYTNQLTGVWIDYLNEKVLPRIQGEFLTLEVLKGLTDELNAEAESQGRPTFELTHSICEGEFYIKTLVTDSVHLVFEFDTKTGIVSAYEQEVPEVRYV